MGRPLGRTMNDFTEAVRSNRYITCSRPACFGSASSANCRSHASKMLRSCSVVKGWSGALTRNTSARMQAQGWSGKAVVGVVDRIQKVGGVGPSPTPTRLEVGVGGMIDSPTHHG